MDTSGKHVCMLPTGPSCLYNTPTSGPCRHLRCTARALTLPWERHHGSALYLRSRKCIRLERERQMSTAHRLLIHPYSQFRLGWDVFRLVVDMVAFLYMPTRVFVPCSDPYDKLVLFADCVAGAGVVVNLLTGWVDRRNNKVILDGRIVMWQYATGIMLFDVIGALPLQLVPLFPDGSCEYPTHTVMFAVKLFRYLSLKSEWKALCRQCDMWYLVYVVVTVGARCVYFLHWVTYLHFQVAAVGAQVYEWDLNVIKWLQSFKVIPSNPAAPESPFNKYVTNLYYVTGLCVSAGTYSPIETPLLPELLLSAAISLAGLIFLIMCFTALVRLLVYSNFESYLFNGHLKELQEYLHFKRLPQTLQQKIQLFINYKFNGHYFNETAIKNTVNEQIQRDINMFNCKGLVLKVPLFQDMPIALVNMIIFKLTQLLYMPGEVIVRYGHPATSLYLIASGTVACVNAAGKEMAHLKDGAFFGEQALVTRGAARSATVVALEITEIYKLSSRSFHSVMQRCPRLLRRVTERRKGLGPAPPPDPDTTSVQN